MYSIEKATADESSMIHQLVHQIYYPTYKDILSEAQIQFMLKHNYAVAAIQESMASGQDFYLIYDVVRTALGFVAVQIKEFGILRIEKLYLLPETQGKGLGKVIIDFVGDLALSKRCAIIELNVNRSNKAFNFYLKQGFVVFKEVDIPYYGFVLDDYIMRKMI